ncbi:STAS/SEC14 domain-containing protein [Polyangium fumosum]|uniref:STAS/SEC14 domain-containing protein n=1 Tax=Polyangium fumosum TaxID=889272 RepID=A0A4V5PNF2_9BACT|nr:STAS/SEC14 domain-containing protein [Polyangium fumosum]TKD12161.1 STAS/SEC14 domain-containing protein [Polyangium fumosum]
MKTHDIGRHTLVYGDDDVSVMTYRGRVTYNEMREILATEDLANVPAAVLLICDIRAFEGMDGETRRLGATNPKPAKRYFTAYLGAGFSLRVFVNMWNRATNFIHGAKYVSGFFEDEAAARAWLLEQREAFEREEMRRTTGSESEILG